MVQRAKSLDGEGEVTETLPGASTLVQWTKDTYLQMIQAELLSSHHPFPKLQIDKKSTNSYQGLSDTETTA